MKVSAARWPSWTSQRARAQLSVRPLAVIPGETHLLRNRAPSTR